MARRPHAQLTRRPGEILTIETPDGELIEATVLGIKGNQVRVSTDAPDDVVVLREELVEDHSPDTDNPCVGGVYSFKKRQL